MKTKQEIIQEAYVNEFPEYTGKFDEAGWTKDEFQSTEYDRSRFDMELTWHGGGHLRPVSLSNINSNNNWIKVEKYEDLPINNNVSYLLCFDNVPVNDIFKTADEIRSFCQNDLTVEKKWKLNPNPKKLTHYRQIHKFESPLY